MTRTTSIAFALAIAFVAGCGGSHRRADDSPLVSTPSTVARPPSTHATTTTVKLPVPAPEPADPYAPTPLVQIGVIEIPKIQLVHPVFEGITLTVIDHGPSHWPGTAMPCEIGNTVFPGHRVTHTHPFLNLDLLTPGDQIVFHMKGRDCVYAVTGTMIVQPDANYVVDQTPARTVTLIACHPKHSAAQRIVVKGKFVADIPRPT